MEITDLILNVASLFLMMIPGIILVKCGLFVNGMGKGISNLVLYIAQPVLVFMAYLKNFDMQILINSLWVLLFSVIAHGIFSLVALNLFRRAEDEARRMLRFATIFSNAAFMGIPLIDSLFGGEATIYASIYNIVFNLFLWSLGVKICTDNRDVDGDGICDGEKIRKKSGASIVKALIHPVTIAAALGLIFFVTPLSDYVTGGDNPLIKLLFDGLTMIKNLVAPLSMMVIGMRLASINFKGFFGSGYLYLFLGLRHIALPLVIVLIIRLMSLLGIAFSAEVISTVVILASTPAASSATMFAEMYDCDAEYTSKLVATSTVVSIITMPVVYFLAML